MKSSALGKNISAAEIQGISNNGIWLFVRGKEYFLAYEDYPWFRNATLSEVYNLKLLHGTHLYWPDLDIDLELEAMQHPEKYPLVYR